jgi:DNA-binding NtrC family response regulator
VLDRVCEAIDKVAASLLSVVITGESGTGKELAAREIHRLSKRGGAFQAINCAAIPDTLIESELFGFRRGAFTGADRDKNGLLKTADGGTLFLDEIGDMPSETQVKLLRAVQFGEIQPLGAAQPEKVDVRVVCATHRNLPEEIASGGFRGDLFARLNEFHIHIPPLRERKEDLYLLTRHFMDKYGRPEAPLPFAVMLALVHYDWPYNVRELESAVKRCLALSGQGGIEFAHLPDPVRDSLRTYGQKQEQQQQAGAAGDAPMEAPPKRSQPPTLNELVELLERHRGNISAIGRELGKERVQVHRWLKRYGLSADDYRE